MNQIGIVLLIVVTTALLYQKIATMVDDRRYPPTGKLIDIGGYSLHLHSTGEGPTVVLDAGLSGTSLGWALVQAEASKFARVCSYDRAGYAWSDPAPSERTTLNIAHELHTLLHKAGIPPPYLLVGHSFGGSNVLMFADLYPEETLGVILVDSVHEMMDTAPQSQWSNHLQRLLAASGYKRVKGPSAEIKQMFLPLPKLIRDNYIAQMNKTGYTQIVSQEMHCLRESLHQLKERNVHLRNKPLIVITAGRTENTEEGKIWNALQKKLLSKSDNAKQLIAENSDHMINHHQPEIIVDAIKELIESQKE